MHIHRLLYAALCAASVLSVQAQNKYKNPIYNEDTPDPTVVRAPNGTFYAYGTGGTCRMSKDLTHWSNVGNALARPTWNDTTYVDENGQRKTDYYSLWALDVSRTIDDKYLAYYACALWGNGSRTGIGVATGTSPTHFTDRGRMFRSTEIGVNNSIDPCYVEEGDKKYIVWGSFNDLYLSELTDDGLAVKDFGKKTKLAGGAFEGVMIYKRGQYYYLFASVGSCCEGVNSTYRTVVGRSTNLKGPYTNKQGGRMIDNNYTTIIKGNDAWKGPGHNSEIITDDAGQDWLLYHAYSATTPDKGRVLMLDKITWGVDNWPTVGNGTPSTTEQDGPVFYSGNGANITYKFKNTDLSKSNWMGWKVNRKNDVELASGKGKVFMPLGTAKGGADFDLSQSVNNLPNGIYELCYNGFSTAGSTDCYVNDFATPVLAPQEGEPVPSSSESTISNQMLRGNYIRHAYGIVTDGTLTIGARTRTPLLQGERFVIANVQVIFRDQDSHAQDALWASVTEQATQWASSGRTYYTGYNTRLDQYRAQGDAAQDSTLRYKLLLSSWHTLDSISSSVVLYDSLRTATTAMQAQLEAATAQGYAIDTVRQLLTQAQQAIATAALTDQEVQDLLAQMAQALHDMEYAYQQGDGSQDHPYVILRPAQLDHMRDVLVTDSMIYFVLGADIDMAGYNWQQLNVSANKYKYRINLDGQGHIISNLTPDGTKDNPSFFGTLCGECRNVGFLNAQVHSTTATSAILCGYMGHSSYKDSEGNFLPVVIENCYFQGSISGKGYIGAMGGTLSYSPVTISNCYSNVQVQGTKVTGNYGGGMIGRVRSAALTIDHCYTAGEVTAYTAGGIVGGGQNSSTAGALYSNVIAWNSTIEGNTAHPLGNITDKDQLQDVQVTATMKVNDEDVQDGRTDDQLRQAASTWGTPWHSNASAGNGYPILEWQYQRGDYREKCGFPIPSGIISTPSQEQQQRRAIYDLQGRQVLSPTRGIYIINGCKTIIR